MTSDAKRQEKSRNKTKYSQGLFPVQVWVKPSDKPLIKQLEAELHAKYNKEKDDESTVDRIVTDDRGGSS